MYEKAIDFLEPLYRANPDFGDVEYSILDVLFALGKSERDFKWLSVPAVLRLDKKTADLCRNPHSPKTNKHIDNR